MKRIKCFVLVKASNLLMFYKISQKDTSLQDRINSPHLMEIPVHWLNEEKLFQTCFQPYGKKCPYCTWGVRLSSRYLVNITSPQTQDSKKVHLWNIRLSIHHNLKFHDINKTLVVWKEYDENHRFSKHFFSPSNQNLMILILESQYSDIGKIMNLGKPRALKNIKSNKFIKPKKVKKTETELNLKHHKTKIITELVNF